MVYAERIEASKKEGNLFSIRKTQLKQQKVNYTQLSRSNIQIEAISEILRPNTHRNSPEEALGEGRNVGDAVFLLKFSRNLTLSEKGAFFARIRHCGEPSSASPELKLGIPTNFEVLVPIQMQKIRTNGVKYEFQNVSESSCPFSFPGDKIKGDKVP